ncbi:MAG: sugar ABC transporter permease [Oscillospiraceae bacterium]|nr:sugar ABC transporter permease [Oscillospiraceae bacterium]
MRKKGRIGTVKDNLFVYSLIGYPLILFCIFYIGINFNSIILAFQSIDGAGKHFAGFKNFQLFWQEMTSSGNLLFYSLINSLKMYAINLVICVPLYICFSYLLFKKCLFNRVISFLVMIPSIMSGLVISLVFVNFIGSNGPITELCRIFGINEGKWINLLHSEEFAFGTTLFYSIWLSFSTSLLVYPTAMRGISPEVFESAQIDGVSNMFQEMRYIILPLIYPTLTTFLVTGFAAIFSNSGPLLEFYYTEAPSYVSNMGYYFTRAVLVDATEFSYPKYAAGGLILTALIGPLTLLLKRFLEKFDYTVEKKV